MGFRSVADMGGEMIDRDGDKFKQMCGVTFWEVQSIKLMARALTVLMYSGISASNPIVP